MALAIPRARMQQIVRMSNAQRHHARAGVLAANVALEESEAFATTQSEHRDAELSWWAQVLSDPLAVPQLIAQAGAWVMDREKQLNEAVQATKAARGRCEDAADSFAVASARDEVAQILRASAARQHDRRQEERFSTEAQDLLLHRRRS